MRGCSSVTQGNYQRFGRRSRDLLDELWIKRAVLFSILQALPNEAREAVNISRRDHGRNSSTLIRTLQIFLKAKNSTFDEGISIYKATWVYCRKFVIKIASINKASSLRLSEPEEQRRSTTAPCLGSRHDVTPTWTSRPPSICTAAPAGRQRPSTSAVLLQKVQLYYMISPRNSRQSQCYGPCALGVGQEGQGAQGST
jgi:hypothetical protein